MCSLGKTISGLASLIILLLLMYLCWDDLVPLVKKLYHKLSAFTGTEMGSGNSSPVGRAKTVEMEAHQDVFELRFDHLAFGGSAVIAIIIGFGLYCLYHQRRKRKHRQRRHQDHRRSRSQSQSWDFHQRDAPCACCYGQHRYPMMPYPPFPMPILPPGHQASSWIPMEMLRQPTPSYDSSSLGRFTEIKETGAFGPSAPHARPRLGLESFLPRTPISQQKNQFDRIYRILYFYFISCLLAICICTRPPPPSSLSALTLPLIPSRSYFLHWAFC